MLYYSKSNILLQAAGHQTFSYEAGKEGAGRIGKWENILERMVFEVKPM